MTKRHGLSRTRLYKIWSHMKSRCYCKTDHKYHRYGARGIIVCNEWRQDFMAFRSWALSSGYAAHLTIDRINNDLHYEPTNCQWSDRIKQNRNRSSTILTEQLAKEVKVFLSHGHKLKEAAQIFNISVGHVHNIKTGRKWK